MPLLRSSIRFCLCVPRVSYRALPLFHPGLCRSAALAGLFSFFYLRLPRVSYRALPLFHPGLCRSIALAGLFSFFYLRLPRVPYRALPSFHPGLCGSAALAGLFVGLGVCGVVSWYCVRCIYTLGAFACVGKCRSYGAQFAFAYVYLGFHIGLCPYSTLGYAGVPPLQGSFHSFICVYPGFHIGLCPYSTLGYAGVSPLQGSLSYCLLCFSRVPYRALSSFHPGLCRSAALSGLIVGLGVCGVVSWYCVR